MIIILVFELFCPDGLYMNNILLSMIKIMFVIMININICCLYKYIIMFVIMININNLSSNFKMLK